MAKASAEGGSTLYVGEGEPVPGDVPDGVRLVGPGAPGDEPAAVAEEAPAPVPASSAPPRRPGG
jgi:hypothetical protein